MTTTHPEAEVLFVTWLRRNQLKVLVFPKHQVRHSAIFTTSATAALYRGNLPLYVGQACGNGERIHGRHRKYLHSKKQLNEENAVWDLLNQLERARIKGWLWGHAGMKRAHPIPRLVWKNQVAGREFIESAYPVKGADNGPGNLAE